MLGSTVLETAIGLVFVYLVFSLIASAIAEYIAALFDRRGDHLRHILCNLFDNDDPRGRTILNLFVAHPMIQALNTTTWKPEFQSAAERVAQQVQQLDLAGSKWNAAAAAVTAADRARAAARKATADAAVATSASAKVSSAQSGASAMSATASPALIDAIVAALAAARDATDSTTAANQAATAATSAAREVATVKKWREAPPNGPAQRLARQSLKPDQPAANAVAPKTSETSETPALPPDPALDLAKLTPAELDARAKSAVATATSAAAAATAAATAANQAATAAERAKKGLGSKMIAAVAVPKYIPDRTFIDALIHVLSDDNTIRKLSSDAVSDGQSGANGNRGATTLWDRFGSAVEILGGVASRLPEGDAKNKVDLAIQSVKTTLEKVQSGTAEAVGIVGQLEKGTNDLLAAVASVADDSLRSALEREIQVSLRPLHALGQNILTLERAGQTIGMMADSSIKTALTAFLAQSGEDLELFKQNVGSWFNDVMDHASGWYKRNTQCILVVIAVLLCTLNNVDTVSLVGHLSSNPEMRSAAIREAQAMLVATEADKSPAPITIVAPQETGDDKRKLAESYRKALDATKLPLWWSKAEWDHLWYNINQLEALKPAGDSPVAAPTSSVNYDWILSKLTGLLISILAVSMGAPFWFDVLNKLVNVRLVGKRPEPTTSPTAPPAPAQPAAVPAAPTKT